MLSVERDLLDLHENLGRSRAQAVATDLGMLALYVLLSGVLMLLFWWWK